MQGGVGAQLHPGVHGHHMSSAALTYPGNNFALVRTGSSRSESTALKCRFEIKQTCLLLLVPENWVGQRGMAGPSWSPRHVAVPGWGLSLTVCEGKSESYWQVRNQAVERWWFYPQPRKWPRFQSRSEKACKACSLHSTPSASESVYAPRGRQTESQAAPARCRGMELA